MPIYHVQVSYSTHGDDPADALATFFGAVTQPGAMVAEVFADDNSRRAIEEFDGDSIVEAARKGTSDLMHDLKDAQQGRALLQLKNAAIAARISGVWDHPALLAFMPVLGGHANTTDDILIITRADLSPEVIAQAHKAWDETAKT